MKIVIALLFVLMSFVNTLNALSVSPQVIEVEMKPAEVATTTVILYNASAGEVLIQPVIARWDNDSPSDNDPKSWFIIGTEEFVLKPYEKMRKGVTINAPLNFEGEKKFYLLFNEKLDESAMSTQIAMPVYMMSENKRNIDTNIVSLNIIYNKELKKAQVSATFRNNGNVHVRPELRIKIKNISDGTYIKDDTGQVEFLITKDWPVFPGTERTMDNTLDETIVMGPGKYKVEVVAKYFYLFSLFEIKKTVFEVNI